MAYGEIQDSRFNNIIALDQEAYIAAMLSKFEMSETKPKDTPLDIKRNYEALNGPDCQKQYPIKQAIGSLMYLMLCTRPDLSAAVITMSKFTNRNNEEVWKNIKRIFRYLRGSSELKLVYQRDASSDLITAYVDSNWEGDDNEDRRSTTRYIFQSFKSLISWNTKRQKTVAASSTEAEYMALYEAVKEALWLKSLASSIDMEIDEPITINEDNQGCIAIANNPINNKRTKHIDIKYHFSRERIQSKDIVLKFVSTEQQMANMFTKNLPYQPFIRVRLAMGMRYLK